MLSYLPDPIGILYLWRVYFPLLKFWVIDAVFR